MIDFEKEISVIKDQQDFVNFIELLLSNLYKSPDEWRNKTLSEYLEGIASWTEDIEGYYKNKNMAMPKNIDWKVFANILVAAKIYE